MRGNAWGSLPEGKPIGGDERERAKQFWHGHPTRARIPKTRQVWWKAKIEGNKARDRMQNRLLRKSGWKVVRIWQHQLTAKLVRLAIRKLCGAGLIASPAGSNSKWGGRKS